MISVVAWLWNGEREYRAEHVNVLARMIRRNLSLPHRFVCVADRADGLERSLVEWFPTPFLAARAGKHRSPEGGRFPSCYRRLWTFSDGARDLGDRLLLLDIDAVAMRELAPLCEQRADFVGWRPRMKWGSPHRYAGGMYLLTAGARREVWERFEGAASIAEARRAGFRGSDQAWLSYALGPDQATWGSDAGIYSIREIHNGHSAPPPDARVVHFNGPTKPWSVQFPWALDHWR